MASAAHLRFGPFQLDVRSRELRSATGRVRLQEQPFGILRALADRPGQVVTRDELCRALWPEGTFVDFEHSLNAAVKRLRAALGDDAVAPRYVETVPRLGYRLLVAVEGDASAPAEEPAGSSHAARLAVLPFANLSGDPAQQYFSDGLTEEMIAQLGRLCGTRIGVLARWSSMRFREAGIDIREVGRALRADYLLEGSVRRDGDRVRIVARLVETAGETHLWAETYERALDDCLAVQADVARRIADSLVVELMPKPASARDDTPRLHPARAGAYQAYLKGRYHWNRPGDEGLAESIAFFDEAIRLDPACAPAYASRARALVARAEYYAEGPVAALTAAEASAHDAIAQDPGEWRAWVALGDVARLRDWNWEAAETAYRRATEINPNSESAHRAYGVLLAVTGRFAEALREVDRAVELDPLCLVVGTTAAWARYMAGDYAAVVQRCLDSIDLDQTYGYSLARRLLSAAYLQTGRATDAVDLLELARREAGDDVILLAWLAFARAAAGDLAGGEAIVRRLCAMPAGDVPRYHLALACAGVGDADAVFEALHQACELRDPAVGQVAVEPRFATLREDARYPALARRLGLMPSGVGQPAH